MKKVILLVMIALGAIGFSGCASSGAKVKVPSNLGSDFVVLKNGEVYTISGKKSVKTGAERKAEAIKAIKFAKKLGRSKGYKYMAIVNKNLNNLSGYPINNLSSFSKLLELNGKGNNYSKFRFARKGSDYLFHMDYVNLKVMYFKEEMPGLFLWKL